MQKTLVLGLYGDSQSGKTTLLERLIRDLTAAGWRVAVIKQTNKSDSVDVPGKDTARFIRAGAGVAVFASAVETVYLVKKHSTTQEMVEHLGQYGNFDLIFIEGAREGTIPKIRLGECGERENTLFTYDGNYDRLLEKIINKDL
jgi:molybdopterin-guanine dinucleotide biosynthesis protein MobB